MEVFLFRLLFGLLVDSELLSCPALCANIPDLDLHIPPIFVCHLILYEGR